MDSGTAGLVGAIIGGAITLIGNVIVTGWGAWNTRTSREAAGAYLALRLSVILEAFAAGCADLITANAEAYQGPDDQYPEWKVKLPTLHAYPDDAASWQAVDGKLAERCLSLRNKIDASQSMITAVLDIDADEGGNIVEEQAALRGLDAWRTAQDLRTRYKHQPTELVWDFQETLNNAVSAAAERKTARAKTLEDF